MSSGYLRLALCCLLLLSSHAWSDRILQDKYSLYNRIVVKETGDFICLLFDVRRDPRYQSCINPKRPKTMVFPYARMAMASLLFVPEPSTILVIGLGGGTIPIALNELFPAAIIDTVEIDPAVVEVAKEYFGLKPSPQLIVHTQDARVWTKRASHRTTKYDIILLDAFNGEYIPEHLMTQEFLKEIQALLSDRGVMISNTFALSDLYSHESATYASVYGAFINFKIAESNNRMIIAPVNALDDKTLRATAAALKSRLKPYAVPITRYANVIIKARKRKPNWQQDARIFTDQFSPANLLQGKKR
ncbi:MAG: spermidine synthase [Gammaproteobacteria bacterium]|nr:spermidine synthase [Gammaproteobacteria bacterium]